MSKLWKITKGVVEDVIDDDVLTFAAALAFYAALSLPPLIVLLVFALDAISAGGAGHLAREAEQLIGPDGRSLVEAILDSTTREVRLNSLSGWIGLGTLLFAASGVFSQLQQALNRIWDVEAKPGNGVWHWIRRRFLSIGIVGVMAFLAVVSLAANAALGAIGIAGDEDGFVVQGGLATLTTFIFGALFAVMFRVLPDVEIAWRDVLGGAIVTSLLFQLGKFAIGAYLSHAAIGDSYGAAGSAVVVLAWVYFSAAIALIGAEITQGWARASGRRLRPSANAVRLVRRSKDERHAVG